MVQHLWLHCSGWESFRCSVVKETILQKFKERLEGKEVPKEANEAVDVAGLAWATRLPIASLDLYTCVDIPGL